MKIKIYVITLLILFSFTSCSQYTISNTYYASNEATKSFDVSVEISNSNVNLTVNDNTFEISNINTVSNEINEIYSSSESNEIFIKRLNEKITNTLDNLGFNEDIIYNRDELSRNNNLLFNKRSELGDINTQTLLLTTSYFNSNNEFNSKNISMMFEILRLFEKFNKRYHLSILFVNNSSNIYNSVNDSIEHLLPLNILGIIDIGLENTLNKVSMLTLDENSKLSTFIKDSINYNSFNFVSTSNIVNTEYFNNMKDNNIDFVRVISETNATDITKCANFLIEIIADILNKPEAPSIAITDSIFRINLNVSNHDSNKKILCKINNGEYKEILNKSVIEFAPNSNVSIKVLDLFGNESDEITLKLY